VNHVEYVSIPGAALAAVDGRYDIRVTEELSEVSYLDQIHYWPWTIPPRPRYSPTRNSRAAVSRVPSVRRRAAHLSAIGARRGGRDVLARLLARDQKYPISFRAPNWAWRRRTRWNWISARPRWTAAPPAAQRLGGLGRWQHIPRRRAGSEGGLVMPYLQMQDAAGQWKTVNEDMGMPAGKPKTIAVELRFPSASRKCGS